MAYEKNEWAAGDKITSAKLNNIEAGIEESGKTATWGNVANRPSTFAPATHTHTIADVTGLQTALNDFEDRIAALEAPEE